MRLIKRLKWKLDYAMVMRRVGLPFMDCWEFAGNAIADDPEIMEDMDGDEAAYEELSYWHD